MDIAQKFQEIIPPLGDKEAQEEAQRCLYCFDAPCITACPTHIDVPRFIQGISTGDLMTSAQEILRENILGATCARICPTEELCEGACVLDHNARPVAIGRLQRYVMDHATATWEVASLRLWEGAKTKSARIAIVGGGPAGLSAAVELRWLGYDAVIYEARSEVGGLDRNGIVSYRLPNAVNAGEVAMIRSLGVTIHTNVEVGGAISWKEIESTYDAVVLATGLGHSPPLGIEGEALPGVYDALDLIAVTKGEQWDDVGLHGRVAIIGAGNTAVDAATCALRLGAKEAVILYRRGPDAMPAYRFEFTFAKQEGVQYRWWTTPIEILGEDHVTGVRCLDTFSEEPGNREAPLQLRPDSPVILPVTAVIRATGQVAPDSVWEEIGIGHNRGAVQVDSSFRTSRAKYYAIGDALRPKVGTVVAAVEQGKLVARALHRTLAKKEGG